MTALIVIDVQNDFLPGGALAVEGGDQILPIINHLLEGSFDLIVATKDWHPSNHGSFASQHGKQPGEHVILNGLEQILWPDHCVQNTLGSEFSKQLNHAKFHELILKGSDKSIDSYSAFFDNGRKKATGLESLLKSHKIKTLYVAGLATDYCVKYSVLDALRLGFEVYVIKDACRAVNLHNGDEEQALNEMRSVGARIITSEDLYRTNPNADF